MIAAVAIVSILLAVGAALAPVPAGAQATTKIPRIGILTMAPTAEVVQFQAFRQALRELGYVEGSTIVLDFRLAHGRADRLRPMAAELVRDGVDVIVADGGANTEAAFAATKRIPIVIGTASVDPVGRGWAKSLSRPGGNVTGSITNNVDLVGKWVELLKEALPGLRKLVILYNPAANPPTYLSGAEEAARSVGLEAQTVNATAPENVQTALEQAARARPGAILALSGRLIYDHRHIISEFALKHRLPLMAEEDFPEAGALMSYMASRRESYRRAASYVDRILKGAKPADLPIEQPTKFFLVINMRTARALGLTIPPVVLLRADQMGVEYPRTHDPAPLLAQTLRERQLAVDPGFLERLLPLSARLAAVRGLAFDREIAVTEAGAREAVEEAERVVQFGTTLLTTLRGSG